ARRAAGAPARGRADRAPRRSERARRRRPLRRARAHDRCGDRVHDPRPRTHRARARRVPHGYPRCCMSQEGVDLLLRGYRAFVAGDLDAISEMLDPEVEWVGAEAEAAFDRDDVLAILKERVAEGYHVTVDRCIGVGDRVVSSMRFSRVEPDETDERPLQSRRFYL